MFTLFYRALSQLQTKFMGKRFIFNEKKLSYEITVTQKESRRNSWKKTYFEQKHC